MIALSIGKATFETTIPLDAFLTENTKTIVKEKMDNVGGAACNVACLFNKWNCETYFSGVIGYDDGGNFVKKELENANINTSFVETNYDKKTSTTFVMVNKSNTSRTSLTVEPEIYHLKKIEFDMDVDIIYSDGFEYTATTHAFNKYQTSKTVLGAGLDNGSNPKEVVALIKHAKYVIFSLDFAEKLTNLKTDFNDPKTLLALYKDLKSRYMEQEIIVTLKNMGAMYQINSEIKVMPTITVKEIDRTSAGDIFDGAFTFALGKKYDLEKCIRVANIAAGLSTTKYGGSSSIPLFSEVTQYYESKFGPIDINTKPGSNPGIVQSSNNEPIDPNNQITAVPSVSAQPNMAPNISQPQNPIPNVPQQNPSVPTINNQQQ